MVIANKCAEMAQECKAYNLASQYCVYVSEVWSWMPFPTKDLHLKKVVFDSEQLLALYDGLPVAPEIDTARVTESWLRQGLRLEMVSCYSSHLFFLADLIETALRSPALLVPSALLTGDLTIDLHTSADDSDNRSAIKPQIKLTPPRTISLLPSSSSFLCYSS